MNSIILQSFFDELGQIEKTAAFGAIGKGLRVAFSRAGQGAKAVGAGLKGAPGALPGMRGKLIGAGLKEMAPAAAITGGGLLAGYGAKKAILG